MNARETAELLTLVQVIDNRRVDEATVLAWHALISDLDVNVAREAVRLHQRESTAYLTPAHVRVNVERIEGAVPYPEDEFGNPLPVDQVALDARMRVAIKRAEVTA